MNSLRVLHHVTFLRLIPDATATTPSNNMNTEEAKQRLIDTPGLVGIYSVPQPVIHERPAGYSDEEWLSYIYFIEWGYNSIIKDRRAPTDFLQKFLPAFSAEVSGRDIINDTVYAPLRDYIHAEYAESNPTASRNEGQQELRGVHL